MARDFGRQLAHVVAECPGAFAALDKVALHLGRPLCELGLVELWTCVDYYAKFDVMLPKASAWGADGSRDIKKALLRIYGQACAVNLPTESYTLRDLLQDPARGLKPGDVLISFNYDTLVERLALLLGHDLRSFHHELRHDIVNFAKPHGSTSWCLDLNQGTVTYAHPDGTPLLESLSEEDVDRGREPLVLGAVPIKSELLRQVQGYFRLDDVFRVVARQWQAVVEAISKTEHLVVVGYGFPKEDDYGRFLFGEAVRQRSDPIAVEYYEKDCHKRRCEVESAIKETLLNQVTGPKYKGPVKLAPLHSS